ncbi:MAG: WxL domain-containing protein [Clostridiales Family XIII bacterium]|jgi:hypothetical protein|nr:WxL domain-containing protein [Clostridiales Family XIII bacterium]
MIQKTVQRKVARKTVVAVLAALTTLAFIMPVSAATSKSTHATVEFEAGDLSLEKAPAFDFGKHKISHVREDYAASNVKEALEVFDLRGGNSGWNVTAALSKFQISSKDSLSGSFVTFNNLAIDPENGTIGPAPAQTGSATEIPSDGTAVKILSAAAGAGNGAWKATAAADKTKLTVFPGTASVGTHQATISWSLQDAP